MRKLIIITILFSYLQPVYSQTGSRPAITKEDYLVKSRHQKNAGFILLGAGITSIAIAAPGKVDWGALAVLVTGGTTAILISIPLFIASGRNKRRADRASATIDLEKNLQLQPNSYTFHYFPAVKLKIRL